MVQTYIRFDMRAPAAFDANPQELYRAALDISRWADDKGFTGITLSEHHLVDDGFLSSPISFAGVIAGATQNVGIAVSALLMPLYDPVRLAEDLAVLDLASGGRVSVTAGLGYRPEEYEALGLDFAARGKRLDECLRVVLGAWSGEPVEYRGATFRVTPLPLTKPHPNLLVGGSTPAAARRAARFGLPFSPPLSDPDLERIYLEECKARGVAYPYYADPGEPATTFVARDPDRAWREIGPYMLYEARVYAGWQRTDQRSYQHSNADDIAGLRNEGKYRILTPEQCLDLANDGGVSAFIHHPLVGGTPPELAWESLELFASEVLPHLPKTGRAAG